MGWPEATIDMAHLSLLPILGPWFLTLAVGIPDGPTGGNYGEPRIVVPAPTEARFAHLAWPKIVTAPDGTLVLGYIAGRAHTRAGCPAVSISTDRGQSFTSPQVLRQFDEGLDYPHSGNVALGVAADGAVVLLAMAFKGDESNTIFGWRSTDSGKTWTATDTSALADNKTGSVYGGILAVPGKGLAICGHYRRPSKPLADGVWIAFSTDHGQSWGPPQTITNKRWHEPSFTFQGRLVGLIRDDKAPAYWQAVSDDLGRTWQIAPSAIATAEPTHYRLPSPFIIADPRDPSRLYALQSERYRKGNLPGRISLWSADARRLDWQRRGLVVDLPATATACPDFAYPWMTPLDDRRWFLVFYAGQVNGANSIYGLMITPEADVAK